MVWYGITYPFPNVNVITYQCWDFGQSMSVKGATVMQGALPWEFFLIIAGVSSSWEDSVQI